LGQQNQTATHFLIGIAIIEAPQSFVQTVNRGEDLAVHTWSHRHTSTLSNEAIVAEIGWTMQIIADGSGGRVPRFWRPPYGDSDSRVRAIANEIFGLTAVIWNQE
jgi:chitin deacetylase